MKNYYLLVLLCILSCKAVNQRNAIKHVVEKGYKGLKYKFSDNGNRNLLVEFVNDTIVKVSNNTSIGHNFHLLNFNNEYLYKKENIATLLIEELMENGSRGHQSRHQYLKPFQNIPFPLDANAASFIFPKIEGDTVRFSADFNKLQIREFCFERVN